MTTVAAFFGAITIDDTTTTVTCDGSAQTITEKTYYIYSPTDDDCLLHQLATALTAGHSATVSYSISASTNKITLSAATTFTVSWSALPYLGFSGSSLSGANSYTATYQPRYSWFPGKLVADSLAPTSRQGKRFALVTQTETEDQTIMTCNYGELMRQTLKVNHLSEALTWNLSDDNTSYEEFWVNTLSVGRAFLFLPDWTTETYYWEYKANLEDENNRTLNPTRTIATYNGLWSVEMSLKGLA